MGELIYSVANIFQHRADSCLMDYDADRYHIAAYQRGYKWGSDKNGAVTVLLNDLWAAFEKSRRMNIAMEYYLQYITLKKAGTDLLEVIDGQQRLTTLSVLLSVFSLKLERENLADSRLEYAVRSSFFDEHIYQRGKLSQLLGYDWSRETGLCIDHVSYNTQDVFYIFSACKKINEFLSSKEVSQLLVEFYDFVLNAVKIIVNVIDHVASEKVFSNLNSNKVPLTESELIKGLFITMYARLEDEGKRKNFREISEQRLLLGRKWDEIERWMNDVEVKTFFFDEPDAMEGFLVMVAKAMNANFERGTADDGHLLFNFFHGADIVKIHEKITSVYKVLRDWFEQPKVYNRLGYLFFHKGSKKNIFGYARWLDYTKTALEHALLEELLEVIPKNVDQLFYNNKQDQDIHKVLLGINIFSSSLKFNFYKFIKEEWSLEHIFPQTPEGKGNVLKESDKKYIIEMVAEEDREVVERILAKKERNAYDKEIYQDAMKRSGLINSLGNLCLLTLKDNIINGCDFYNVKRTKVLGRIKKGAFVPIHTYEVFSKLVFDSDTGDFERWTVSNIQAHRVIIEDKIKDVRIKLKAEKEAYESRKVYD